MKRQGIQSRLLCPGAIADLESKREAYIHDETCLPPGTATCSQQLFPDPLTVGLSLVSPQLNAGIGVSSMALSFELIHPPQYTMKPPHPTEASHNPNSNFSTPHATTQSSRCPEPAHTSNTADRSACLPPVSWQRRRLEMYVSSDKKLFRAW